MIMCFAQARAGKSPEMTDAVLVIDARPTFKNSDWTTSGLPHAEPYYAAFPHEPSPLGDLTFSAKKTTAVKTDFSLLGLLPHLAAAGTGGAVVLVCHAWTIGEGLLIPVAPGGKHKNVSPSAMRSIDQLIQKEADVAAIDAMPRKDDKERAAVIARWKSVLDGFATETIPVPLTEVAAQALYEKSFLAKAQDLEFKLAATLRQLLARVQAMREKKVGRLELRACEIGKDMPTLELVRKFFGVDKITAPTRSTFFITPTVGTLVVLTRPPGVQGPSTPRAVMGAIQKMEDNRTAEVMKDKKTTRGFVQERKELFVEHFGFAGRGLAAHFALKLQFMFVLQVVEDTPWVSHGNAWVTRKDFRNPVDTGVINKFVRANIMDGSSFSSRILPLMGLYTPDKTDKPYVLPLEAEYTEALVKLP
jgi:hypothetical protein